MIVLHNTASLRVSSETFVPVRLALWRLAPVMFVLLILELSIFELFMDASTSNESDISTPLKFA